MGLGKFERLVKALVAIVSYKKEDMLLKMVAVSRLSDD